jgi:hypothetical protein
MIDDVMLSSIYLLTTSSGVSDVILHYRTCDTTAPIFDIKSTPSVRVPHGNKYRDSKKLKVNAPRKSCVKCKKAKQPEGVKFVAATSRKI